MRLYHWTSQLNLDKLMKTNILKKRRWKHYIEDKKEFLSGTSWGLCKDRWKSDHEVCIEVDSDDILNERYFINGNKVYLRTQGLLVPNFDPNAWLYESTDVDECFIVGDIKNIKLLLKNIN